MEQTANSALTDNPSARKTPSQVRAELRQEETLRRRLRFIAALKGDKELLFALSGGKEVQVASITDDQIDKFVLSGRRA
jgi:hypothetical protein